MRRFIYNFLPPRIRTSAALLLCCSIISPRADQTGRTALEEKFKNMAEPFMRNYCFRCHGKDRLRGDFDLRSLLSFEGFMRDEKRSMMLLDQVSAGQMPPEDARQPSPESRKDFKDFVQKVHRYVAERNAGDPGVVLARRLSNAEYDYAIRDLTGVELHPTREFPVDPANEAGFDNSGESLSMSPALVKKYLDAARDVATHMVLKPDGMAFASHPMIVETDRDKYCVRRIIDFYQKQPTNYASYFFAAWRFQTDSDKGTTIEEIAREEKISARYLGTIWHALAQDNGDVGPIAALQTLWRKTPAHEAGTRSHCEQLANFIKKVRGPVNAKVGNLRMKNANPGTQALVLWKDREMAGKRRHYGGGALDIDFSEIVQDPDALRALKAPAEDAERKVYEAEFEKFCDIFPDSFFISERARIFTDAKEDKLNVGRYLSAGFHNQFGYFRDDQPLYDLVLNDEQRRELDELWRELDFIALAPLRQHSSSIWFDRAEAGFLREAQFDPFRAEDRDCASPEKYREYMRVYMEKVQRNTDDQIVIKAFEDHFRILNDNIRWVEKARLDAEPSHLSALADFAQRAYRRPLEKEEREDLIAFYQGLRASSGLEHEEAVRECIVSVLMSPSFFYRVDSAGSGSERKNLNDFELASRLSFFLWSSLPDRSLIARAAAGELHKPGVLVAEARRMLRDKKISALATEFGGNWLEFRRFEEHNAVDRERFPMFDNTLRQAMFEEPVRLFLEVFQNNRSILDLILGEYTFVNEPLARHYGMPAASKGPADWVRVDDATKYGRGGLLPMAVFLTKNAPGLRTSPVKRGYWVVRRVLGEHIPPPPPKVPELPSDESKLRLSLREMLVRHREDTSCAACHARFDSFGLVFEGFGPVGEARSADLAGHPVDTRAPFPDGKDREGISGLREYLLEHRRGEFVENFCRKLLAFALGRSLMLSDEILVEQMRANLEKDGYTFDHAVEMIVTSSQFLQKRAEPEFTTR